MDLHGLKHLVVGSGFWGSTLAERIASVRNEKVLVVESRSHIGGNSYSEAEPATGIECHKYGSHIFHTKNERIWRYLSRFGEFNNYRHRVLTQYRDRVFPMPIGLATVNQFYGLNLKPSELPAFLKNEIAKTRAPGAPDSNLEDKAISLFGRPLYEAFIEGYTWKQWQRHPRELPEAIITRLPVRTDYVQDYFDDPFQGIPKEGYSKLFERMLKHSNIQVALGTDYFELRDDIPSTCKVYYSGPIDRFFDYRLGKLEWRSLRFEKEILPVGDHQGTAVMNFADREIPYTRIHEFRHYHPERNYPADRTVINREYPLAWSEGLESYFPVNTVENQRKYESFRTEALGYPRVVFGGRLGSYRYWNMDQAIDDALKLFESLYPDSGSQGPA